MTADPAASPASTPLLSIHDVHKRFGGVVALHGVSIDVPPGIVYGLIGPNGSGKTTLFNIITGFLAADRGTITFDGRTITRAAPHAVARLGICRTFQATRFPQMMTVMENMLLAPQRQTGETLAGAVFRPFAVRAEERENLARARELLAIVNLSTKIDELAGNLSGGQKKLLALAQALMAKPKLILLDEPVAGVNPLLVEEIAGVIRRLCDAGQSFLIVEHNMGFIRGTCERVSVLDAGEVIAEGEPDEVLARTEVLDAYLARRPEAELPAAPRAPR